MTLFGLYLAAHLLAYVLALRHLAWFRTEKGIFLFHFSSAVLVGLSGFVLAALDPAGFGSAGLVLIVSVHGIYSLSFLELWSLAQGGYSLSVIASIATAQASGEEPDFSRLEGIGQAKQDVRLAGLARLGLVERSGDEINLAAPGRTVAHMLHALLVFVDPRVKIQER